MVEHHLEYLRYVFGSQSAQRHPWRIDPPLYRLTHDTHVQSMAVLYRWQVYLPRLEGRVELRLEHQFGLRRAHLALGLDLSLPLYSGQR